MHQGVHIDRQQQLHEPHEEERPQQGAEIQLQPCCRPGHVLHPFQLNVVLGPLQLPDQSTQSAHCSGRQSDNQLQAAGGHACAETSHGTDCSRVIWHMLDSVWLNAEWEGGEGGGGGGGLCQSMSSSNTDP